MIITNETRDNIVDVNEIQLIINNIRNTDEINKLECFIKEIRSSKNGAFDYIIERNIDKNKPVEVRIGFLFQTRFITINCKGFKEDISKNLLEIDSLEKRKLNREEVDESINNKINELSNENKKLREILSVIEDTLYSTLKKRDYIIEEICSYINTHMEESSLTYIKGSTRWEKMLDSIYDNNLYIDANIDDENITIFVN